ncbi:hypothetical protein AMECASPLE_039784 [Ameca splendens]|uniref:Uncharacterized protein n=1 Tax=Ameca splendens TaxID=208324 RepID=A0ABV0Z7C2_9TELE
MGNVTFYNCDVTKFKQFNVITPVSSYVELLAGSYFSHCVVGTGSIPVGTIPMRVCNTTYYYSLHQAGPGGKVHDLKGTYVKDGFHWMCGTAIYSVQPSLKRELIRVKPHEEFKHRLTGNKILLSLGKNNMFRIETIDYRLGLSVNAATKALTGLSTEVTAL